MRIGKINVDGMEIQILQIEEDDYISLTDMVRKIDNGPVLIENGNETKIRLNFLVYGKKCPIWQLGLSSKVYKLF